MTLGNPNKINEKRPLPDAILGTRKSFPLPLPGWANELCQLSQTTIMALAIFTSLDI